MYYYTENHITAVFEIKLETCFNSHLFGLTVFENKILKVFSSYSDENLLL